MRRSNLLQRLPQTAGAALVLVLLAPTLGRAQLVDSGTVEGSLECVTVNVVDISADDVLNLREGPGVQYQILARLPHDGAALATGLTAEVGSSVWYQVGNAECKATGWANSRFLEVVSGSALTATTQAQPSNGGTAVSGAEPLGIEDDVNLSPLTTGLLWLGFLGLLVGATLAFRPGKTRRDDGPPPGMVGPPGGPYYLARVNEEPRPPRTIQVGGSTPAKPAEPTPIIDLEPRPIRAFGKTPDGVPENVTIDLEGDHAARLPPAEPFTEKSSTDREKGS